MVTVIYFSDLDPRKWWQLYTFRTLTYENGDNCILLESFWGGGCEILTTSQRVSEVGQIICKKQCFVSGVDFNNPYTRNAFFWISMHHYGTPGTFWKGDVLGRFWNPSHTFGPWDDFVPPLTRKSRMLVLGLWNLRSVLVCARLRFWNQEYKFRWHFDQMLARIF